MKSVVLMLLVLSIAALLGCGAASNAGSSGGPPTRVLQAIEITPGNSSIAAGLTEQFTATGKYSDGTTTDLTSSAAWQCSNTSLAAINSRGLLSSKAPGSLNITASSAGVSGTADVAITTPNLSSIVVSPAFASAAAGTSLQFTAIGKYSDGSSKDLTTSVIWKSSNPTIASIGAGLATAVSQGNATITAALGNIVGSAQFAANAPNLLSIAINPPSATIAPGTSENFRAVGSYSDGSTHDVTATAVWKSSSTGVAAVAQGLAKSVVPGNSVISATVGKVSAAANLTVTNATLNSISLTPQSASIPLGTLQQFTAAGSFSDGTTQDITNSVNWSSSASSVVSIIVSGLATGRNLGNVNIIATWGSGAVSASTPLNVNSADVSSLSISPANPVIAATTSIHLIATGLFNDGGTRNLTTQALWTSSDTSIATVGASSGIVKGLKPGTVTITATFGTFTATATLAVTNAILISTTVTPLGRSIAPGTKLPFTATGLFSDSSTQVITNDVSWASDNSTVATISASGVATGVAQGVSNMIATLDGVTGSAALNVSSASLSSISVSPSSATMAPASILAYQATGQFSDGTTQNITSAVNWSSSNSSVVSISASGVATGQSAGPANITAQFGSVSGNAAVVVGSSPLVALNVTPANTSIPESVPQPFSAAGTFGDGTTQNLTNSVTWTSSASSVAVIGDSSASKGIAKGLSPGSSTITAAFAGIVGTASLSVNNATLISIAVTPSSPIIALGNSQQFSATAYFSDGSSYFITTQVTWTSSAPSVATISSTGLASSSGTGTTTITGSWNGVSATAILTVQ